VTFIELDYAPLEREDLPQAHLTIKCSWCGEIIRLDGEELALAMCQSCYERMLADFLRQQQLNATDPHASDR